MSDPEDGESAQSRTGPAWGLGVALGMGLGVAIGVALGNIGLGIGVGLAIGVAFAVAFGARDRGTQPPDAEGATGPDRPDPSEE